jgi:RNA polymerase sigma-70 factor (ECF subfamily)
MAIARNRALNVLRDEARLTVDSEAVGRELERAPGGRDRPERETLRRELRGEIMAGLAALNPARREAIVLRDVEGFSYAEVAEVMAVTEGAARVQVHRAREQLRVLLAPYLAADERSGER